MSKTKQELRNTHNSCLISQNILWTIQLPLLLTAPNIYLKARDV